MRRRRGFILLYALAVLGVVLAVVLLLTRAAGARTDSLREENARETALRAAESALEQGRAALGGGRLQAGQTLAVGGLSVACLAGARGGNELRLETLALLAPGPGHPKALKSRGVRVSCDLRAVGSAWKVVGWRTSNETVAP